jgi:quercetin dioxygenase-like cupin family protein
MSSEAENVWADIPDWGGVGARRLVRAEDGSLGGSLWEFQPSGSQFVYHFHHGSEELIIVLRGEPTVRLFNTRATSVVSSRQTLVPTWPNTWRPARSDWRSK